MFDVSHFIIFLVCGIKIYFTDFIIDVYSNNIKGKMQENNPYLLSVKNLKSENERFKKIQITSNEFTIGRSLGNSVVITYLAISRKHCSFTKINESDWAIEDFSSFGIEVNNQKLNKGCKCRLSHNDIIKLDATGEFVYKYIIPSEYYPIPRKRIKLENNTSTSPDINNVKLMFEESQDFEIKHIEAKIQNAKQLQTNSMILKQQLELDMTRKMQQLENDFALQIENLKGEKNEVERQRSILQEERDMQLAAIKTEMDERITDLMDQIQKHNETESELLNENASLKEKLLKEREDFLAELHRENSSKQDLLEQLEAKIKEQEEIRLQEKKELEIVLKNETEQLRLAKEKELEELEKQKKLREQELQQELNKIKLDLQEQVQKTESEKRLLEKQLTEKMEEMKKVSDEEKNKVEQLVQERAEAEKKLTEAQINSEKSLEELRKRVNERETELAALAAQRIQQQAEQSSEVITSLQQQLENVRSQLQSVETEKNVLLESICMADPVGESTSKQAAMAEVGQLVDNELQCSICAEIFVAATTLNCSHTYCRYCITVWKKKKKDCPICRAPITSECRSLVLDSFIEKIIAAQTDEMKKKREAMLKDRQELDAELARQNSAGSSRRRDSFESSSYDSEYYSELGEEEEDYYYHSNNSDIYYESEYEGEYVSDHYDSGSDGSTADTSGTVSSAPAHSVPAQPGADAGARSGEAPDTGSDGDTNAPAQRHSHRANGRARVAGTSRAYYGGYGRCYRCGARGHWAPGCPLNI